MLKYLSLYHRVVELSPQNALMGAVLLIDKISGVQTTIDNLTTRCCVNEFAVNLMSIRTNWIEVNGRNINLTDAFFKTFQIVPQELTMETLVVDKYTAPIEPQQPIVRTEYSPPALILSDEDGREHYVELVKANPNGTPPPQPESKPIELINNTKALSTLTQTLMQTADKSAKSRKSAPKQTANQVGSTNPSVIALELFDELYRNKFTDLPPPKHSLKDKKAMAELCDHYGGKIVSDTIQWFFTNYDTLKQKYKWEYPSIGLFNGFRNTIFPLATKKEEVNTNPQWGSHHNEKNDRADGDEIGFGFGDDE